MTTTLPRVSWIRRRLLDRGFYFGMSLLIVATIAYGFSFTIERNLLRPAIPRPALLYVHAAVFSGWLALFVVQSALVQARRVRIHRQLGWLGAALAVAVVVLGTTTAVVMGRFNIEKLHATTAESDLMVPLFDMVCFGCTFALAILWRRRPEVHRRLVLVATCALTAAAFGRFPGWLLPPAFFYAGVDLLILLGVARDLAVLRRVHPVYLWVLPAFVVGQGVVTYTVTNGLEYWKAVGRALLR